MQNYLLERLEFNMEFIPNNLPLDLDIETKAILKNQF